MLFGKEIMQDLILRCRDLAVMMYAVAHERSCNINAGKLKAIGERLGSLVHDKRNIRRGAKVSIAGGVNKAFALNSLDAVFIYKIHRRYPSAVSHSSLNAGV